MKRGLIFVFFVLFFINGIYATSCDNWQTLHPGWLLCEDWDTGTPTGCWPCETVNCRTPFKGWSNYIDGIALTDSGLNSSYYNSYPNSYYIYKPENDNRACVLGHNLPNNLTHIFVRFYIYFTDERWGEWDDWANYTSGNEIIHWIFMNTMYSSSSYQLNLVNNKHWGITESQIPNGNFGLLPSGNVGGFYGGEGGEWFGTSYYSEAHPQWTSQNPYNFIQYFNKWTCIEYELEMVDDDTYGNGSSKSLGNLDNIKITEWINGIKHRDSYIGPGDSQDYFDMIFFHLWDNAATPYNLEYYLDDIVVSNSYIGPINQTPQIHEADTNSNGCVDQTELTTYIPRWYAGTATMQNLMSAIALWIDNIGC